MGVILGLYWENGKWNASYSEVPGSTVVQERYHHRQKAMLIGDIISKMYLHLHKSFDGTYIFHGYMYITQYSSFHFPYNPNVT